MPAPGAETRRDLDDRPVRDRLLEAGRDLFAADGYESASTAAVARRAGTSESQLIKHFGSKQGLLEAIFDERWHVLDGAIRTAVEAARSPVERLALLSRTLIAALGQDRRLLGLMLLEGRRPRRHGGAVVLSTGFRDFLRGLDAALREARKAGHLITDVPVDAVRSALVGAVEGLLRDRLLAEQIDYPARYDRRALIATFDVVLGAFLTPAGRRALPAARRPGPPRHS
jgi:AcrR family transcriptional regulator